MSTKVVDARVKIKKDTAANWDAIANDAAATPLDGEAIIYGDILKIGNGSTSATALPGINDNCLESIELDGGTLVCKKVSGESTTINMTSNGKTIDVVIPVDNWNEGDSFYSTNITVDGIAESDEPFIYFTGTADSVAEHEWIQYIDSIYTYDGYIVVNSIRQTSVEIPVRLKVVN